MTETEQLLRDIHTVREPLKIDWPDLYSNPLKEEDWRELRTYLEIRQAELKSLIERLWALVEDNSN